ncbi:growth inhibitor PemK [Candidatus Kaiserbacteria bacterium CG10_big_fil_rev_8_21_14_0_10_51_14]|uniref:Growth inhibitor PemK n=1 Tax=Candidatus Kaiserbacteria bacterium CG10_big_fil_rev_8_21_14_0_10_51_14 TaxID=1974610 RepID=A0A2H0UAZ1_9BACT|nr:MAG: growth inhibitor PemK [Candidatus Kaiserbacteria bacterium CG10_big_fil_rev_8_21_14_0_10_51_14]
MTDRRGDVVATLFPFADGVSAKKRPALICAGPWRVTSTIEVCWVVMITTTILKGWPGDLKVPDPTTAGLPVPSIIRTLKLACIDTRNITRTIGTLDKATLAAVQRNIQKRLRG